VNRKEKSRKMNLKQYKNYKEIPSDGQKLMMNKTMSSFYSKSVSHKQDILNSSSNTNSDIILEHIPSTEMMEKYFFESQANKQLNIKKISVHSDNNRKIQRETLMQMNKKGLNASFRGKKSPEKLISLDKKIIRNEVDFIRKITKRKRRVLSLSKEGVSLLPDSVQNYLKIDDVKGNLGDSLGENS
jgi:hypothetical protein